MNAAEEVFAEHGFDGARLDMIAQVSGYNKSLIGQYFGDKLGLYVEVLKRIDREVNELQDRFDPLLIADADASNPQQFKLFLETAVGALFDYLLEHPRFIRMLNWEMAEGWQSYREVASRLNIDEVDEFDMRFLSFQRAGLLRSNFNPTIQMTMILQICISYLSFLPLYQLVLPGEDVSSGAALARGREYIISFVVAGIMLDPPTTELKKP